jgi:hypothetical protein
MSELSDQVFVFSGAACEAALAEWLDEQLGAYPHQEERIRITALAMRDFLMSEAAGRHKMRMRPNAGPQSPSR